MKFLAAFFLTALLAFIAGLYAPWWIIAPIAFLVALLVPQRAWMAGLAAFLAVLILWCLIAWWIDAANESLLSAKVGELIGLGANPVLLILLTGFVGGLVAGFAALAGHYLRSARK